MNVYGHENRGILYTLMDPFTQCAMSYHDRIIVTDYRLVDLVAIQEKHISARAKKSF